MSIPLTSQKAAVLAQHVKDAAFALRKAASEAAEHGLQVELEVREIRTIKIEGGPSCPLWDVTVSVSRQL